MEYQAIPRGALGRIALSLCGGGTRAVGFHLGTMAYLEHLGILRDVTILSTVSGGTLVGLSYALSQKDGTSFRQWYRHLVDEYLFTDTIQEVYRSLGSEATPSPAGRRNLVTAMADVYDRTYFKGRRFGVFWEPEPRIHLRELVFNATEFKTGIQFRFQKSEMECRTGNEAVWVEERHARQIRLADIMTASSDIPGALEPMFFPDDFHWPDDDDGSRPTCNEVKRYLDGTVGEPTITLMDGGVYDNQGSTSVLLAAARQARQRHEFDKRPVETSFYGTLALLQGRKAPLRESVNEELQRMTGGWASGSHDATCPKCNAPLESQAFLGATVEQCTRCRGIWFDPGQVEQVVGREPNFGTFIISDTPTRANPVYEARDVPPAGGLTLDWLSRAWAAMLVLCMLVTGAVAYSFVTEWVVSGWPGLLTLLRGEIPSGVRLDFSPPLCRGVSGPCSWTTYADQLVVLILVMVFLGLMTWGLYTVRRRFDAMLRQIPGNPWKVLGRLTLRELVDMLRLRLSSLFAMANDIFTNRIRLMGYALLYGQSTLRRKIVPNEIDTLLREEEFRLLPEWLEASPQMRDVIVPSVAAMKTRLWIAKPEAGERGDLDRLLACGQFTLCFNLLKHIWLTRRNPETGEFENTGIAAIFKQAKEDWMAFREDAFWLVDRMAEPERAATALPKVVSLGSVNLDDPPR